MSAKISDMNGSTLNDERRSKSQVSIFDYPEHLNPFYEDENHKRLRFWKIGKKDGTSSRRGSFSLGGLREMWTFKSFRGKKKSSTLGINKTSESPEPLRRTFGGENDGFYGTYDPRYRNTYDNGTINGNFQRNVPYRTSLQNMNYTKDINSNGNGIGFMRNDTYRSTIQIVGRRDKVNGGGSYSAYNTPTAPPRRPSQLSVASSTNPFEEDDYEDDQSMSTSRLSIGGSENGDRPTPAKRRARKKRRAPPPPVPIPKSIDEETSNNSVPASPTIKTTITINTTDATATTSATAATGPSITETNIVVETKFVHSTTPTPPPSPNDDEGTSQREKFENQLSEQMNRKRDFSEQEKLEISNIAAEIEHYVKLLSQDDDDDSSIRLIPIPKSTARVLKKAKSSTSIVNVARTDSIKKSGSEGLMQVLLKGKAGPSKAELNKWRESSLKQKKVKTPVKEPEARRGSVGKPVPASRQRPSGSGSPTAPVIVGVTRCSTPNSKSASPQKSPTVSPVKPIPSTRQQPSPDKELILRNITVKTVEKNEVVQNGVSPNITTQSVDEDDHRSASSKENTPLNSSYGTTTDESAPPSIELKITESKEDISEVSNASSERYHIRYVPLKEGTPETPLLLRKEYRSEFKPINDSSPPSSNTSLVYNESWVSDQHPRRPSVERRRSVKEIIESINRSQSLLKVNQEAQKSSRFNTTTTVNNLNGPSEPTPSQTATPPPRRSSKDNAELQESYSKLSQSEAEIKRMMVEMDNLAHPREMNSYCDNVPSILDRFDEEVNNNDIFKKCVLKKQLFREGSPTASNLDWNPLPKPKRTKNLSVVLNNDNATNANMTNGKDQGK